MSAAANGSGPGLQVSPSLLSLQLAAADPTALCAALKELHHMSWCVYAAPCATAILEVQMASTELQKVCAGSLLLLLLPQLGS